MKRLLWFFSLTMLTMLTVIYGQEYRGSITGEISDASRQPSIPGAQVVVTKHRDK